MKKILLRFILGWAISILAIYLSSLFIDKFNYDGTLILVLVGLGFSIISSLVRPLLKLLSLPFPIIGPVLLFVVNSFIIFILGIYVQGFNPGNMINILEAGAIVSVVNFILHLII